MLSVSCVASDRKLDKQPRLLNNNNTTEMVIENLYSPNKHGRTINSTNQDTNTNQIKTKKQ